MTVKTAAELKPEELIFLRLTQPGCVNSPKDGTIHGAVPICVIH